MAAAPGAQGLQGQETTVEAEHVRHRELRDWLSQRRLYPLLVQMLEQEMVSGNDPEQRSEMAGQLAELYAWQLNTGQAEFAKVSTRLDELVDEFPDAIPLPTQTSVVFGRYRRAKDAFESWIWNRQDLGLRTDAQARFSGVIEDTEQMIDRWRLDGVPREESSQETASSQRQLNAAISQLVYLAGWSRYYRSLTMSDLEVRRELLLLAEADFLQLLAIADRDQFIKLAPQWFPLNSEWTCRLVLGMGMVSQSLEHLEQAEFAFDMLTETRVPLSIRNNQRVWRFHSMLFPGQLEACRRLVDQWQQAGDAVAGDIGSWSTVAMAGLTWPDQQAEQAQSLTLAGLTGLARANEFQVIDDLILQYPVDIRGDTFFAQWLAGYASLKQAEAGVTKIETAIDLLADALNPRREKVNPVYRARCRYHYGFALYVARNYDRAADQFRQAVAVLQQLDPVLAEHADWMQCQAQYQLASSDASWRPALQFQLQEYLKRWPDSLHAPQAVFMQIMQNLDEQSTDAAIATLLSLPSDDPNYERAQYEICRMLHRSWSNATDAAGREELASRLLEAANQYMNIVALPREYQVQTRFTTTCLLAADVLLNGNATDVERAGHWLARCQELPAEVLDQPVTGAEYRFLLLNLATTRDDPDGQLEAAVWLLDHSPRPAHRRAALIAQARLLDAELQTGTDPPAGNTQLIDRVIDVYQRLVDEYESEGISMQDAPALAGARLRLAELSALAKRHNEALQQYRQLYAAFPKELAYLLGLARSEMSLGNFERATGFWRTISNGLPAGHETWLESKYNLMLCLSRENPREAWQVWQQTRLLVPELPEPWRTRWQELETELRQRL